MKQLVISSTSIFMSDMPAADDAQCVGNKGQTVGDVC